MRESKAVSRPRGEISVFEVSLTCLLFPPVSVDLNLVGYRFNWALSIFFIAYMLVEVPSQVLLVKFGPRYYIPALTIGFGMVSLCTAFVTNFAGLCVCRVFLGIFEGGKFLELCGTDES